MDNLADGVDPRDDKLNTGNDNNAGDDKVVVVDGVELVVVLLDDDRVTVVDGVAVVENGRLDVINGDVSRGCIFEVA